VTEESARLIIKRRKKAFFGGFIDKGISKRMIIMSFVCMLFVYSAGINMERNTA
jgi:hypothetical protein